jgi:hypothetical protein
VEQVAGTDRSIARCGLGETGKLADLVVGLLLRFLLRRNLLAADGLRSQHDQEDAK